MKRDGVITRVFSRIKDGSELKEFELMAKEGLINITTKVQDNKAGVNPTLYTVTTNGIDYFNTHITNNGGGSQCTHR